MSEESVLARSSCFTGCELGSGRGGAGRGLLRSVGVEEERLLSFERAGGLLSDVSNKGAVSLNGIDTGASFKGLPCRARGTGGLDSVFLARGLAGNTAPASSDGDAS